MASRKYTLRVQSRACENFGAVDYTIHETITEVDSGEVDSGGLQIDMRTVGICEGSTVDQRSAKFWPNASLDKAHAYRMSHGYTEDKS